MNHDGGTLTLASSADGTQVEWATSLTFPLRSGGKIAESVTAPMFKSAVEAILAGCAQALEG
jgi:hypothetical protein